ncbi:NUDIX hydrolase [Brevibacillus daliensis]|uniref:NUDIX hydrolase n=1 Tax=Brevibacillus daliensis TaxID=2892995 RepID=UPI001E2A4A1D|nr:NUDIX domain-containing protein [Brevibacillus daliensis]
MKKERFTASVTVHMFLLREQEVLLLRRFQTGYEDGNYSVVAGHLDGDEEVMQAAFRETREEAGVELVPQHTRIVGVMHRKSGEERIDFFVVATDWIGEIVNCEPHKCDELAWYPLDNLPSTIIPYVREALQLSVSESGMWFQSYGFANKGGIVCEQR